MEKTIVTHSDGLPVLERSGSSAFENPTKQRGKVLNILPASFYQDFLSQVSKERLPNPSESNRAPSRDQPC